MGPPSVRGARVTVGWVVRVKEGLGILLRAPVGKWLVLVPRLLGWLIHPLQLSGRVALSSHGTESELSRAVVEGLPPGDWAGPHCSGAQQPPRRPAASPLSMGSGSKVFPVTLCWPCQA